MQIADSKRPPRTEIEAAAADEKGSVRTLPVGNAFRRPARSTAPSMSDVCVASMRTCRLVGGTRSSDVGIHRDGAQPFQRALNVSVEGDDIKKESGMNPLGVHIAA